MQNEVQLWRENNQRRQWIEYLATFEDGKLVRLRNVTNSYEIPLNTKTAKMIERRHPRFRIDLPSSAPIKVPPSVSMRYVRRYDTGRYSTA